jgi:nitrate/nitrite transport system permease protein
VIVRGRAAVLSLVIGALALGFWELAAQPGASTSAAPDAYSALVAKAEDTARIPPPSAVLRLGVTLLSDPFYDRGPNDKGIGLQLAFSILRVAAGYTLAVLVALPLGFLIGMSPLFLKALNPYIQLLKPISPLAWMPLALFIIEDSILSSVFVIFICSIWPILINTAFGVASVDRNWINIARTLELSPVRTALTVILPAALPTILTGMRIAVGIAWLVIVAAEMLVGGTGVGYFIWNEWNNLDLAAVIFTVVLIGAVGMVLDFALGRLTRLVEYQS